MGVLMFSVPHIAQIVVHCQMKSRVVVLDSAYELIHGNVCGQFFSYLTPESLLRSLTGFNLPSREFPFIFMLPIAALRGEDFSVRRNDSGNHFYLFHNVVFSSANVRIFS